MKVRDLLIHHPDGSYEPKRTIKITTPSGEVTLSPGVRSRPGVKIMGFDITELLDMDVD